MLAEFIWQSDWNGDEVGYPECNVVGLYMYYDMYMYLDTETNQILEYWFEESEDFS